MPNDKEPASAITLRQKVEECTQSLQSVYTSGSRVNLILDLFVEFSDAANRASGLTAQLASDATGMSRLEAWQYLLVIAKLTGDSVVVINGEPTLLYQTYEPRSIGKAAQGEGHLIRKRPVTKVAQPRKSALAVA